MLLRILRSSAAILLAVLLTSVLLNAQQPRRQGEEYEIADIEVEGARSSDVQTIITLSGLRPGDKITLPADEKISKAITNLWKRKQFSDIEIVVEKTTPAGVFLKIKVEEFPRMSELSIEGNDELNDKEIEEKLGLVRGDILSGYGVYRAKQKIKDLYEEEGLMFAKINEELQDSDTTNFKKLFLRIQEGVEFHVDEIEFIGNNKFDDNDLAGAFKETKTKAWWHFWRSDKFDKKEYDKDLDHLRDFFKKEGYIDGRVLSDSIVYNEEEETVNLVITVDEGQRTYVRNVAFEGNTVYPDEALHRRLNFEKGDPYDMERFEMNLRSNQDQSDVSSLYMDHGYLMARFEKKEKRVEPDSVDITIEIVEGERVKNRRVDIVGNTKTKDRVIRRELYTYPGDYFNRSAVIRSIKALGAIQYFNPEALQNGFQIQPVDNTQVDIEYKVEEQSTDTFNASVGFAGSFGLTGSVGMTFNNFSLSEPFKGGAGQVLNFNWQFGQGNRYQVFSIGFTEPWLMSEPTTVGFNLYHRKINYNQFQRIKTTGLSLNSGRRFRWPDDYFRGDLNLRFESNDNGESVGRYYRPGENTEITLGAKLSRISLDNQFFPTSGSRFSISSDFAMGAINLGSTDYMKTEFNFEMVNPLLSIQDYNRLVLYMSTKFGHVNGVVSDTAINPIELYTMGGNGLTAYYPVIPLRGYENESLGPRSGGKVMTRSTAELRFAVTMNPMPIYVYTFAEAGNVWDELRFADPFNLKRAAGIGMQLRIQALGIVGFSYGYGFDTDRTGEKSGWQFLFHLGQNF